MKKTNLIWIGSLVLIGVLIFAGTKVKSFQKAYIKLFKITTIITTKNKQGKLDGESVAYLNGKVNIKGEFKNGLREGSLTYYYPNGAVKSKGVYINDKIEGELLNYFENGTLRYKGFYKKGKLYGDEYFYYPNKNIDAFHSYDVLQNKFNIIRYSNKDSIIKVQGGVFSRNIYTINSDGANIVLKDSQSYKDIDDLYVTVSTPSNLNISFFVKMNDVVVEDITIKDNTLKIPHALLSKGIYNIMIGGKISDKKSKVIEQTVFEYKIIRN